MAAMQKYISNPDYLARFVQNRDLLSGARNAVARDARQRGIQAFDRSGFPTPRVEEWKFTDLKALASAPFDYAPLAPAPAEGFAQELRYLDKRREFDTLPAGTKLFFVDGHFNAALSDAVPAAAGVTVMSLAQALHTERPDVQEILAASGGENDAASPFLHLNTALMTDGVVLHLGKGVVLSQPLLLIHFQDKPRVPVQTHVRNLFLLEEGAEATVMEVFLGNEGTAYFTNVATEIRLGARARLHRLKMQKESAEGVHLGFLSARLEAEAFFESFHFNTGAKILRNENHVTLNGTKADCRLNAVYMLRDRRHADQTSCITHDATHCRSEQMCKTILDDAARGVFQGKTHVKKGAQKTDGYQLNQNILLSPRAQIDTKPELEIYADDVKCSHGATTGALDDAALFYLRSRGLSEHHARKVLVEAFLFDAIDAIGFHLAHAYVKQHISNWMSGLHDD